MSLNDAILHTSDIQTCIFQMKKGVMKHMQSLGKVHATVDKMMVYGQADKILNGGGVSVCLSKAFTRKLYNSES